MIALALAAILGGLVEPEKTGLLGYQLEKLDRAHDGDVLLLGDSSLGNAVDAASWSQALGRPVWKAALTGEFGYGGSLNMLRRALRRFRPGLVVLFHSVEMPSRRPDWKGLVYTAERMSDLSPAPLWDVVATLADFDVPAGALGRWISGPRPPDPRLVAHDYVPQHLPAPDGSKAAVEGRFLAPHDVRPVELGLLARIAEACRAAGVPCLYAHGPYVDPPCAADREYLVDADARIEAAGLPVVDGTPICMTRAQAGDSEDHVSPAERPAFSAAYRRLVVAAAGNALRSRRSLVGGDAREFGRAGPCADGGVALPLAERSER